MIELDSHPTGQPWGCISGFWYKQPWHAQATRYASECCPEKMTTGDNLGDPWFSQWSCPHWLYLGQHCGTWENLDNSWLPLICKFKYPYSPFICSPAPPDMPYRPSCRPCQAPLHVITCWHFLLGSPPLLLIVTWHPRHANTGHHTPPSCMAMGGGNS